MPAFVARIFEQLPVENMSLHVLVSLRRTMTTLAVILCLLNAVVAGEFLQQPQQCNVSIWVVSSRRLPQSSTGKPLPIDLDYYHMNSQGQLQAVTQGQFAGSLQQDIPCCLFVHGSFMRWKDIQDDSRFVADWVRSAKPGRPMQFVYFTWPSDGYMTFLPQVDIGILGHWGEFNGLYVTQVISQIPRSAPVLLMGHSFGCRAITSSLHLLGGGAVQGYRLPTPAQDQHRLRALLTAAAIDHHWLNPGERYGNGLCRVEHLVSLRNQKDAALSLYPLRKPFGRGSLGRDGFKQQDLLALGTLNQKVSELDVTNSIGAGHGWPYYYRQKQIARTLGDFMFFAEQRNAAIRNTKQQHGNSLSHTQTTSGQTISLKVPLRETYSNIRRVSVRRLH